MPSNHPTVITRSDPKQLSVEWDDGHVTTYTARQLRLLCPCAQCVHEWTGRPLLQAETVPQDLTQTDVKMVGNYALTVHFSDGHHLGIFTFPMLRENDPTEAPAQG